MNAIGFAFTLASSALLVALPRKWAPIPLLIGVFYMTRGQILNIGPAHFTVMQILVTVGMMRVLLKGEWIEGGVNRVDLCLIFWGLWFFFSSAFHTSDAWLWRTGVLLTSLGSYFLFRIFIRNGEDVKQVFKALCILLIPVAMLMILEKFIGKDYIATLGGVDVIPNFRKGHFRAQGAFAHAILAGTAGAGCFPMALFLWKNHRKLSLAGLFGAGGIIFAATSSGPVMMLFFSLFGLWLWKFHTYMRSLRWLVLIGLILLDIVMQAPVYFLMARIDISGGSQGYYRAQLIRSSIEHLHEWWAVGTDYTRHWMASGVPANNQHADIVNHFLAMGVSGGFPLLFLFMMVLVAAFHTVGKALQENENVSAEHRYLIWMLGSTLFGYIWMFLSASLFDQSVVLFHLVLASIGAVKAAKVFENVVAEQPIIRIRQWRYATAAANEATAGSKCSFFRYRPENKSPLGERPMETAKAYREIV